MSDIPNWDQCFVLLSASSEVVLNKWTKKAKEATG